MEPLDILRLCKQYNVDMSQTQGNIELIRAMREKGGPTAYYRDASARLKRQAADRREDYRIEIACACALLQCLDTQRRKVLYGYYIDDEDLPTIADKIHYTLRHVQNLKKTGEAALAASSEAKEIIKAIPAWYCIRHERGRK